ncbi:MAG: branched-chain amino acid ABC transporter permease [Chloroflexi bacterium]|nr:branched-chain amino acid ABC transporter permease [Chloroflexota bacterium]
MRISLEPVIDNLRALRNPRQFMKASKGNIQLWANLFVIGWAVVFMLWQGAGFAITVGTVFAIWAMLAVSLNLVVGFAGLLSVGHIGFFGIGAYSMAILSSNPAYEQLRTEALTTFAWPFFAALPVSVLLAGAVAIAVGVVFNRFRDDIYVLVSFGFAIIAFNVFLNWRGLTRGAFGIHEIARPKIGGWSLGGELEFMLFVLAFLAIVMLIAWFIVTSSFGRVLTAIREDEEAIEVFGYQATHYKLAIWVISAMIAGLAGGLFASWTSFIDPFSFILLESILLVSIVILGGLATIWGSLLGAMAFVLLEEGMRFLPFLPTEFIGQARQAVLGILLVLLMLFRPQGLVGKYRL